MTEPTARPAATGKAPGPATPSRQRFRGQRLGRPESGPGSLAPFGRRALAFLIDVAASGLVAGLFVRRHDLPGAAGHLPGQWSLVPLAADYLIGLVLLGRTFGMYLTGLRVIRVDRNVAIGPLRAAARTALLVLLIPAVVIDSDLRGLHDRLTGTAVIVH
ncbi:RDD family protein [Jatrophihabitans telluris]|uniref:RDD family protein n=1 Tax=Jatrophihabitans telluris TaxID=2038343 RepID=A0ABY4QVH5_9ACTN|nr:RDD family protein [Jatrophihabitans telluris]UQX87284.1 RDD family protein [Jatrophihabitans telluris]